MIKISRFMAKRYGLDRYFTGNPCSRGHVAERRVDNWSCTECNRENARKKPDNETNLVEVRVRVPAQYAGHIRAIAADFCKEKAR